MVRIDAAIRYRRPTRLVGRRSSATISDESRFRRECARSRIGATGDRRSRRAHGGMHRRMAAAGGPAPTPKGPTNGRPSQEAVQDRRVHRRRGRGEDRSSRAGRTFETRAQPPTKGVVSQSTPAKARTSLSATSRTSLRRAAERRVTFHRSRWSGASSSEISRSDGLRQGV